MSTAHFKAMALVRDHGKKKPAGHPQSMGRGINHRPGMRNKRRWAPPEARRKFEGSSSEGQGFAFRRKQKIQQQYRKLLRKEKKVNPGVQYTDNYPEHLKHLYEAEEEMLKKQKKKNEDHDKEIQMLPEQKESTILEPSSTNMPSTTNHTNFMKKTSNMKAKEEYERIQAKRAKKKEEALKRQKEREEAQKLYKQRKIESYKIISKKTKKGQPNLNLQMEYLLQKIQQNS